MNVICTIGFISVFQTLRATTPSPLDHSPRRHPKCFELAPRAIVLHKIEGFDLGIYILLSSHPILYHHLPAISASPTRKI